MTPWQVLGLADGERDPAVIRRAYARALREHRPDSDPEGFRRVRDAYEVLRSMASDADPAPASRMPVIEDAAPEPVAAPAPAPAPPAPPAIPTWRTQWRHAAARVTSLANDADSPPAAMDEALAELGRLVAAHPPLLSEWDELLVGFLGRGSHRHLERLDDATLRLALAHGVTRMPLLVGNHRFTVGDWQGLIVLAAACREAVDGGVPIDGAAQWIAAWVALVDYPTASALASGPVRGQGHPELDHALLMGSAMRRWSELARFAAADVLTSQRRLSDAAADTLVAELQALVASEPESPVIPALVGRLPERHARRIPGPSAGISRGGAWRSTEIHPTVLGNVLVAGWFAASITLVWLLQLMLSPGWVALAVCTTAPLSIWGTRRLYRRWHPNFYAHVWPWIEARIGPFTPAFWLLQVWWLAIAAPVLLHHDPDLRLPGWTYLAAIPIGLIASRWMHRALAHGAGWRSRLPDWWAVVRDVRLTRGDDVDGIVRIVPAMLIGGWIAWWPLAILLEPAVVDASRRWLPWMLAPAWFGFALVATHGWLSPWWRSRPRRWLLAATWLGGLAVLMPWAIGRGRQWGLDRLDVAARNVDSVPAVCLGMTAGLIGAVLVTAALAAIQRRRTASADAAAPGPAR